MYDLVNKTETLAFAVPQTLQDPYEVEITGIDLAGVDAAQILVAIGAISETLDGTNHIELHVEHSDDDVTYTDVTADDVTGPDALETVTGGIVWRADTNATDENSVHAFGYRGDKRYLQVTLEIDGTMATGGPVCVIVEGSHLRVGPSSSGDV